MITESEAREMEAGTELNRICAEWMGWVVSEIDGYVYADNGEGGVFCLLDPEWYISDETVDYSGTWSAAGPLLEAMDAALSPHKTIGWVCNPLFTSEGTFDVTAPEPELAAARSCAVLVARGVERGEL